MRLTWYISVVFRHAKARLTALSGRGRYRRGAAGLWKGRHGARSCPRRPAARFP